MFRKFHNSKIFLMTKSIYIVVINTFSLPNSLQKNVHDELDKIFGSSGRMIETGDLKQLTVLERCIKETLRRFASAPFILRKADKDIELRGIKFDLVPFSGVSSWIAVLLALTK